MENRKRVVIILACLLIITIGNLSRNFSSITIRTVDFITIWVIGALSGLLIQNVVAMFRKEK